MAVYDLEEQEKIDELKAWWKQWGNAIIAAVAVFVIVFSGIQWWRSHQRALVGEAATLFAAVTKAAEENEPKKVADAAKAIVDKYPASAYAPLGHYVLADLYSRLGRPADAAAEAQKGRALEKAEGRRQKAGNG